MNYYEHHIGDYDKKTAHLTACEDGIYSRLIRRYYDKEQPLQNDLKDLQRKVRARTREEKEAVETILNEFFELDKDLNVWRHKRCDDELARYFEKRAKARDSANSRWANKDANALQGNMRTHSERNANASKTHTKIDANGMLERCSPDSRLQTPVSSPQSLSPLTPLSQGGNDRNKTPEQDSDGGKRKGLSVARAEWKYLHGEAERLGFRKRHKGESFESYRQALKLHERSSVPSSLTRGDSDVLDFASALKKVAP